MMPAPSYMKLLVWYVVFSITAISVDIHAQNLVSNGSFEQGSCPTDIGQITNATGWSSLNALHADLFHTCANEPVAVPQNAFGTAAPSEGNAYAGIFAYGPNNLRSYISTTLAAPMQVGNNYCVSFRAHIADVASYKHIKELGVFFSVQPLPLSDNTSNIAVLPQLYNTYDFIEEGDGWVTVSGEVLAIQPYAYLSLGNFFDNASTTGGASIPGTPFDAQVYYFIDEVRVDLIPPAFTLEIMQNALCTGDTVTIDVVNGSGEDYVWYAASQPEVAVHIGSSYTFAAEQPETFIVSKLSGVCTTQRSISINPSFTPQIEFTATSACVNNPVYFFDKSQGITSQSHYEWDIFDDGTIEDTTLNAAVYTFEQAGTYPVRLRIFNENNCFGEAVVYVAVSENCDPCLHPLNVVSNYSAEILLQCPNDLNQLGFLKDWYNPTDGSPDFFSRCYDQADNPEGDPVDVPDNIFGSREPLTGNSYFGIFVGGQNFREYLSTPLSTALLPNVEYCVSFSVALAGFSDYAAKDMGILFTADSLNFQSTNPNFPFLGNIEMTPQIAYNGNFLTNTDWYQITGTFTPNDTLRWLTLGNFKSDPQTPLQQVAPESFHLSYYFIDDVSVRPLIVDLPADTTICAGDSILLNAASSLCTAYWIANDDTLGMNTDSVWVLPDVGITTYYFIGNNGICEFADSFQVQVIPQVNAGNDVTLCPGDTAFLFADAPGALSFQWSPITGLNNDTIQNPYAFPQQTTTYFVEVQYAEANICANIDTVAVIVPDVFADAGADTYFCLNKPNDSIQLQASGGDIYHWSPETGLSNPNIANPLAAPAQPTSYVVEVSNNDNSCFYKDSVFVNVFLCDDGGPDWVLIDSTVTPIIISVVDTLYDTTNVNTDIEIILPDTEDPDEGDSATITALDPANGSVIVINNNLIYTPDSTFVGIDEVTVIACDQIIPIECDTLQIIVVVLPDTNTPPIISIDGGNTPVSSVQLTTNPDSTVLVCFNIYDLQDDDFNFVLTDDPTQGEVIITEDGYCISYTANPTFLGTDTLVVTSCDELGNCNSTSVLINIVPVSFYPSVESVVDTIFQGTATTTCFQVIEPNGDDFNTNIFVGPENGLVALLNDTCIQYFANPNFVGNDTIVVQVCDDNGFCSYADIIYVVVDELVLHDDYAATPFNTSVQTAITDNDAFPAIDTLYISVPPVYGVAVINTDTTLTYTPNPDFSGTDSLTYTLCSGGLGCETAQVFIDVIAPILPPVAVNDTISLLVNSNQTVLPVLANDTIADGTVPSVFILDEPENGTMSVFTTYLLYTPDADFIGNDTIVYLLCIENGTLCDVATVYISVSDSDAPPCTLHISNAFSPNNDGYNDTFIIPALLTCPQQFSDNELTVYNRWGNVVYRKKNYGTDALWWNGTYMENGEPLPDGTYFYLLDIKELNKDDDPRGSLELFR